MVPIVCSSPFHDERSGESDWQPILGEADRVVDGMVCPACARLDAELLAAANVPPAQPPIQLSLNESGDLLTVVVHYSDGTVKTGIVGPLI